jgi:tetratricopeptide (TPR) repeat protein
MDVAWSPDGRRLAVAARLQVQVRDAATGEEVLVLRGLAQAVPNSSGFNASARFSPEGKSLLAVCHDSYYSLAEWSVGEPPASGRTGPGGPEAAETARRLQAAERRAAVRLLADRRGFESHAEGWYAPDSLRFRHHYRYACAAALTSPQEFLQRAAMHERAGRLDAARADLDRTVELAQGDFLVLGDVGHFEARHGRWDRAAPAFAKCLAANPDRALSWLSCADVALIHGDGDGHRRHCREALRRFALETNPWVAASLAWGWLLRPDFSAEGRADGEIALQLADRAVAPPEGEPNNRFFALTKALAEYRAGRLQAADEWLTRAEKHRDEGGDGVLTSLCRALVDQGRGWPDAARQALDRADQIGKKHWPQGKNAAYTEDWQAWAWAQRLRAEAEALCKIDPAPKAP